MPSTWKLAVIRPVWHRVPLDSTIRRSSLFCICIYKITLNLLYLNQWSSSCFSKLLKRWWLIDYICRTFVRRLWVFPTSDCGFKWCMIKLSFAWNELWTHHMVTVLIYWIYFNLVIQNLDISELIWFHIRCNIVNLRLDVV